MIRVRPFKPGHFDVMTRIKPVYASDKSMKDRLEKSSSYEGTIAYTFFLEEKAIAAFFGTIFYESILDIVGITTDWIDEIPIKFVKQTKSLLAAIEAKYNIHRSQMCVREDFRTGKNFAESLGFKHEGTLRSFGSDKKDYAIFGKVKEGWQQRER